MRKSTSRRNIHRKSTQKMQGKRRLAILFKAKLPEGTDTIQTTDDATEPCALSA